MLYHNVMWKFCDAEGKTLDENIEIVKAGLTALPEKISQIKSLTFIKNEVVCDRDFDAMLTVVTENEDDLNAYKVHPEHQKVASYVKKVTSGRAAVDYYK